MTNCLQCVVDWSATGEMLQGVGANVGGVAIIIAAWFGSNTFENWKKQKISEQKFLYAEKILTSVYKARRELSFVRSSFMSAEELAEADKKLVARNELDDLSKDRRDKLRVLQAVYMRLDRALESRKDLEECYPFARAIFGEKLDEDLQALNHVFHSVRVFADAQAEDRGHDPKFAKTIQTHLYEGYSGEGENDVDTKIKNLVSEIERMCFPVLRI